jgi:hypothetical protein
MEDLCKGSFSHVHPLLCFIVLLYFIFTCIVLYQKHKKISLLYSCGNLGLPPGIPVMHTIHDPRKTVMNPHNRVGITEYNIHYINKSFSLTWPLGQIQMPRRASSLSIAAEHIDSIGSPGHASTLQVSDRETILIRTGVVVVSIVLLIVIIIVWPS